MATLDDKLLGEKLHYYCSSSEDDGSDDEEAPVKVEEAKASQPPPNPAPWTGASTNTGPKGVVQDYLVFQKFEKERLLQEDFEKIQLAKKLTLSCQTEAQDEAARAKMDEDEKLLAELMEDDDSFMKEYMKARIKQMTAVKNRRCFGELVELNSADEFLTAVDNEGENVSVVILIYERGAVGSDLMLSAFGTLSRDYPGSKFCCIRAAVAGLSHQFKTKGVPAILVYRGGNVIANFVKLLEEFGKEICHGDVENFLIDDISENLQALRGRGIRS